ncbi:hypothetical protein A3A95_04190 [Candidatus Nomurabacteria bacterium RIFCSPLOWO2_01_FULL_39_18]|uniref:Uncharacterized protein n=1 Tax=Candidatus Nomurabacteria bacterium RIFCSPHIGHO2_01_FULL_40_24b TaxID=1801739 RepID=A0A1F6V6K4_9BACT|nr:MAG: hypothetical protein A2647_04330 [Candidatus Nomurabacteria bacterium RIFCSPHIGHO2_01_FULL_40_24b]OGI89299.1 MAG: hypothetical protein A3A95_04190 [Candidatus Nomurabacteria bacterium RIFCSPLOWO2_01_FULL_39_18]
MFLRMKRKKSEVKKIIASIIIFSFLLVAIPVNKVLGFFADLEPRLKQDLAWGVLAINPDKANYKVGETAKIEMAILDNEGIMDCGADLQLEIKNPDRTKKIFRSQDGSLKINPECYKKEKVEKPDFELDYLLSQSGTYELKLKAKTERGEKEIVEYITAGASAPFEVQRKAPTRIVPMENYTVSLIVKANKDFEGVIEEQVPSFFKIFQAPGSFNIPENPEGLKTISLGVKNANGLSEGDSSATQSIKYSAHIKAGQTIQLDYIFYSPSVSPGFYLLGPLKFYPLESSDPNYSEPRSWQIAVDATTTLRPSGDGTVTSWASVGTGTGCGATPNLYQCIDEDPDSNDGDTSALTGPNAGDGTSYILLGDTPADFVSASAVTINVSHRENGGANDTIAMTYTIVQSDESTAITAGNGPTTVTDGANYEAGGGTVSVTGTNTKTVWDGARMKIFQNWTKNGATDATSRVRISAIEVNITYVSSIYSGTAYDSEGGAALASKTVNMYKNSATSLGSATTDGSGNWSISASSSFASGDIITFYIDGDAIDANTVIVSDGAGQSDVNLYGGVLAVRNDSGSGITNDNLLTGQVTDEGDIIYGVHPISKGLTVNSNIDLHVWTGDTYIPGANITTQGTGDIHLDDSSIATFNNGATITVADDIVADTGATLNINTGTTVAGDITTAGTATITTTAGTPTVTLSGSSVALGGGSNTLTFYNLTGSGSGATFTVDSAIVTNNSFTPGSNTWNLTTSGTPLAVAGTFTAGASTISFQGSSATTIPALTYYNLDLSPASGSPTYTIPAGNDGWDLSTASFLQAKDVSAESTANGKDVFFKSDGTKMYTLESGAVNEYNLSTAWDVSTASFLQVEDISAQGSFTYGLFFKSDGLKMYVGEDNGEVHEYDLSPAWDISTAAFVQTEDLDPANTLSADALYFKSDGLKLYALDYGNDKVDEYDLSPAWDVSTATYLRTKSVTTEEINPEGMYFKSDGTKMYISGNTGSVYEYDLSSAWDVSSASFSQSKDVSGQNTVPYGIFFKSDGVKMYVSGVTAPVEVNEYDVDPATSSAVTVSNDLTLGGSGNVTFDLNTNDPVLDINGSLTIGSGDTFSASNSAATTIAGSFTNNGTFTHNSGTITFDSTAQADIGGSASTTFNNFSVTGIGAAKTIKFKHHTSNVPLYSFAGTFTITGTSGNLITITSDDGANPWLADFAVAQPSSVTYASIAYGACSTSENVTLDATSTNGGNNGTCWIFPAAATVSGTTNAADSLTVRVAVNGSLAAQTGTTSGGIWSISSVSVQSDQAITVFLTDGDGDIADSSEATAVAKYDGTGDMTGIVLNTNVLSVGSVDDKSLTVADLDLYDCNADEDIMYAGSVTALDVQGCSNSYSDETIQVESGDTLTVDSDETLTTDNAVITGTLTQTTTGIITASGNITQTGTFNGGSGAISGVDLAITSGTFTSTSGTLTLSGNYSNSGTFANNGGTVAFTATDTGNTLGGTLSGTSDFSALNFNGSNGEWTLGANLETDKASATALSVSLGTLKNGGFSITGNGASDTFSVSNGAFFEMSGASAYPASFSTYTYGATSTVSYFQTNGLTITNATYGHLNLKPADVTPLVLPGTLSDIAGNLTIGDSTNAGATGTANNPSFGVAGVLTIASGATLATGTGTITLSGSGTPFVKTGTFTPTAGNTISYTGTSATNITAATYDNLTFAPSSSATYTLPGSNLTLRGNLAIGVNTTVTTGAGTIIFAKGGTQTWTDSTAGVQDIGTVQVSVNGTPTTLSTSSNVKASSVTVDTSQNLDISSDTLTLTGTGLTLSGSNTFTVTGSTVDYSSASSPTIANTTFNNLTISGTISSGTQTAIVGGTFNVTGTFTPGAGTITVNGGGAITNSGTLTFQNLTTACSSTSVTANTSFTVAGTLTNGATCTIAPSSGSITLSASGTPFVNSGTFTGSGTHTMNYIGTTATNVAVATYNNLGVGSTSDSTAVTYTLAGDATAAGGINIGHASDGSFKDILDLSTRTLTLSAGSGATPLNITAGGTFTASTSTVEYTGTTSNVTATTYNNLTLGGTGTYTMPATNTTLRGNLVITSGAEITTGAGIVVFAKGGGGTQTWTDDNVTSKSIGIVQVSANVGATTLSTSSNVKATSITVDDSQNLNISGDTLELTGTSSPLTLSGSNTFTVTGSTVTYSGTTANVTATTFNDLTLGGTGTYTMPSSAIVVGGMTTISTGATATTGTGAWTQTGSLVVTGTLSGTANGTITGAGDVTGTGTVNLTTAGTFEQLVGANQNFGPTGSNDWNFVNLTFGRTAVTPTITTQVGGTGNVTISGTLNIGKAGDGAATVLDPGDIVWSLSANGTPLVFNASSTICSFATCPTNTSTFNYTYPTGAGSITVTPADYYNLGVGTTSDSNAASTFTLGAATTTTNALTIGNTGSTNADILNTSAASNFPLTVGSITITSKGTLTANNSTITIAGSDVGATFTNDGTFNKGTSTVVVAPASVNGVQVENINFQGTSSTDFHNFTSTSPNKKISFNQGSTFGFYNDITLTGSSESGNIVLDSIDGTSQWTVYIDAGATISLSYIVVRNSACAPSTQSVPKSITILNGGNNGSCWAFVLQGIVAPGAENVSGAGTPQSGGGNSGSGSGGEISGGGGGTLPQAFTGSDATALTTYDSNWALLGGSSAFAINTNAIHSNASATDTMAKWNIGSFNDNQYIEITLGALASGGYIGGGVRLQSDQSGYGAYSDSNTAVKIIEWNAGTPTTHYTGTAFSPGDVLRLEISGTNLTLKQNGTTVTNVSDSTYSSGRPGLVGYGNLTDTRGDDFYAGSLSSQGGGGGGGGASVINAAPDWLQRLWNWLLH